MSDAPSSTSPVQTAGGIRLRAEYPSLMEDLAQRLAAILLTAGESRYLTPDGAARYLGVKRKRIYDLKSMRALEPDGFDGRTPLWTRETLDAYVRSCGL